MTASPKVKAFSIKTRLAYLGQKRAAIKARIEEEMKRPVPCSFALQRLKRLSLRIKDEMTRYDGILRTLSAPGDNSARTV